MLQVIVIASAILTLAHQGLAAELSPEAVFDRAVANVTTHLIHSGCAELVERVEVHGQAPSMVYRRIVFEGDSLGGRFRDDYSLSSEQPPALMMRCGSASNTVLLTAIPDRSNVNIGGPWWTPAAFGDFGRLGNHYRLAEPLPSMIGFARSVRLIGQETFEGSPVQVIEVSPWSGARQKVWIDPARGYVCPRQEFYEERLLVSKTETSGYFVEPASKLYFPEYYAETLFDRTTGAPHVTWKYHVDPTKLKLNQAVPDEEFSITVPERGIVQDQREGGRDYRAKVAFQLAFDETLNLDAIAALEATSAPRPRKPPAIFARAKFGKLATGVILVLACGPPIALIALVLFVRRMSRPRVIEAEAVD